MALPDMEPAMNAIVPFQFGDQPVRIEDRDGQPWFVLADVCRVLGLSNPSMAAKGLDDDEQDALSITDPIGRSQDTIAINESGFYKLVLRSRKAAAKRLVKWVTGEVLPSIRRTGSYGSPATALPRDPRQLLAYIARQAGDMVALEDANADMAPKADAFDRIADARGALTFTEAAKVMKMARSDLIRFMMSNRWIYRAPGNGRWMGYRDKEIAGLIEHRISRIPRSDGTERVVQSALITAKGVTKLAALVVTDSDDIAGTF